MTRAIRRNRRRRFKGCGGKARFASFDEAKAAHSAQAPYLCHHCECWHLTSRGFPEDRR